MLDTGCSQKAKVALKFCGCCNPQVDLSAVACHVAQMAEGQGKFTLVPLSEDNIDVVVILCGCPRACGNKEEVKAKARWALLLAGERLDGELLTERQLPSALQDKLERLIRR